VGPRAGTEAVEKIKITGPCRESNPGRPALDLVTTLDKISWIVPEKLIKISGQFP